MGNEPNRLDRLCDIDTMLLYCADSIIGNGTTFSWNINVDEFYQHLSHL